jgi:hypothetical protein
VKRLIPSHVNSLEKRNDRVAQKQREDDTKLAVRVCHALQSIIERTRGPMESIAAGMDCVPCTTIPPVLK